MSRYVGQHFGEPAPGPAPLSTAPVMVPVAPHRRSRGMIAAGLAALVLAASGGFFAGRVTAPDSTPSASVADLPGTADELLQQGLALHTAGKLDEATTYYKAVLKKDANNKFAYFNLGQIAQTRQQYDAAIEQYKLALKTDANFGPALYNIGLAYASKGDRTNAIANLRKANDVTPNSAPTLFNLGTLLVQDGKTDEGTKMIAQALTLDPTLKPKS